jgi:hypothetical protein
VGHLIPISSRKPLRLAKEDFAGKTVEVMGIGKKGGDILSKTLPVTAVTMPSMTI